MPGKALIVEDSRLIAETISTFLRQISIEPVVAGSLEVARNLAQLHRPDLAFLDVSLPDGEGTSLINYLRMVDDKVEIIVMTGSRSFDLVTNAIREGAADFLEKPFSPADLRAAIFRALKRRTQRGRPSDDAGPMSILYVDEDSLNFSSLIERLAQVGFTTQHAATIEDARSMAAAAPPDILIVNVAMEGKGAMDFIAGITADRPDVQVVALANASTSEIAVKALRQGALDILLKPVDGQDLQRAALAARRARISYRERTAAKQQADAFRHSLAQLEQTVESKVRERTTELARAQELSERVLQSLMSGILVVDQQMRLVEVNAAAERMLGFRREDVLERPIADVPVLDGFREGILRTLTTGQRFNDREIELSGADGTRVLGYGVANLVGRSTEAAIVTFQDITNKKKLENYLRQTDRLASLGMMASGVTVEATGALNVALGHLHMVARDVNDPVKFREHVEKIQSSIKRAGDTLARIRSLMSSHAAIENKPADLHVAIHEAVEVLERKFRLGLHSLAQELTAQLPDVMGDLTEFKILFINLLLFICDANPNGGLIRIRSLNHSAILEIVIVDTGSGISSRRLSNLFEPFAARGDGGADLRLPLCKSIVDRYNGSFLASPGEGDGTVFSIRFPTLGVEHRSRYVIQSTGSRVNSASNAPGNRVVALLANAPDTIELCRQRLEAAGFTVRCFQDSQEGIVILEEEQPRVLIVDAALGDSLDIEAIALCFARGLVPALVLIGESPVTQLVKGLENVPPYRTLPLPLSADALVQAVALVDQRPVVGSNG